MPDFIHHLLLLSRVARRVLNVLLKRNKKIHLLYFNCKADYATEETLIVRYFFKNAVLYKFDGRLTINERHIIVRSAAPEIELQLVVYGFFRRADYTIRLQPDTVNIVKEAC